MIGIWSLIAAAVAATCPPISPNGLRANFESRAPALGSVILEIPLFGDAPPPESILAALDEHNLPATLLVTRTWANEHGTFLRQAAESGHEVGLWLSLSEDLDLKGRAADPDLKEWISAMRVGRKTIRRHTQKPVLALGLAMLPPTAEIAGEAMGFRAILPVERTLHDRPRRARSASTGDGRGSNGRARIIGQGAYNDGCGHMLPHWSPAGLDRATSVAARGPWVRIGLPSDPLAGPLLTRWTESVLVPHQWSVLRASEMAESTKRPGALDASATPEIPVPKVVGINDWRRAASAVAATGNLPRNPTPNMNLTETFYGLTVLLSTPAQPTTVTLGRLDPPREIAPRRESIELRMTPEAVRAAAEQLRSRLRGQLPSLITVDGHTLTAAEAIQVFARVFLDEPAIVTPVHDPDPYAPGGGWGQSKGR